MHVILDAKDIEHTPYISSSFTPPQHKHAHSFFELTFCIAGHAINTINGTPFSFQNGTCSILRPGDVHSLTEYDPLVYEHIDLYIQPEPFQQICNACHKDLYTEIVNTSEPICFPISNELASYLFNQSLVLKDMIANNAPLFSTVYTSMIANILSAWIKNRAYQQAVIPVWLSDLLPKFNDVSFIQKNISQIAATIGFSLPYFSSQFKKYMGVTAIEYLIKKRIHLSKDLLKKDSHLRILDISAMLGFENPSTFSKHFMQEFKMSPREYRKQTKK